MHAVVIPSFLLLAGICGYAAVVHIFIAFRHATVNYVHLLFAGLCALTIPFVFTHIYMLQATNVANFVFILRLNITLVAGQLILFVWFIAFYSNVRQKWPLYSFSLLFVVLSLVNWVQPFTLQYLVVSGLSALHLPWGEVLVLPQGENSIWFKLAALSVLLTHAFAIYVLALRYRRGGERVVLVMMLAIVVYIALSIQGMLVRLAIIDSVPLGVFGYLGMVIVMGGALIYENELNNERLQAILDNVPAVVYTKDLDGRYLMINRHYEDLFHVASADLVGKTDVNLFPQAQIDIFREHEQRVMSELTAIEFEEVADKAGVPHTYLSYKFPLYRVDSTPYAVCGISTDITARKQMENAIRDIAAGVSATTGVQFFHQLVQSLHKLFHADYVMIGVLDDTTHQHVKTLAMCTHGLIVGDFVYALAGTPCEHVMDLGTCIYPNAVHSMFPQDKFLVENAIETYIGTPLLDAKTVPVGIIVMLNSQPMSQMAQVKEILEIFAARAGAELARLKSEAQMRDMAYQDYLTRLPNRALLHSHLREVLARVKHAGEVGAMLMIDLDHFKIINNALSHDVGDDVLREVGRRLVDMAVPNIFIARLGGDEFVVLMELGHASIADAEQNAKNLAEKIMQQFTAPLLIGEHVLNVGTSVGAVLFTGNTETELDILRHAEMALYKAKGMGRNNVQFYLSELQTGAEARLKLEDGLRMALANRELSLFFQPQVDAQGCMIGAEVLLRWHHPEMGNIPPSVFIPVAEEAGLIHSIGTWVLDEACRKLATWLKTDVPYVGHLSVNVSAWQFARADFVEQVRQILTKHDVAPARLMLEVTESALLYDLMQTIDKLKEVRALGVQVSLDDFGTGYSSLAYLKDLPLDELKIDKAFIDELLSNQEHSLVATIIAIGHCMKLKVIAEGVESAIQRDALIKLGCASFQGYLFAKPLAESDFLLWIAAQPINV